VIRSERCALRLAASQHPPAPNKPGADRRAWSPLAAPSPQASPPVDMVRPPPSNGLKQTRISLRSTRAA
jgi:hypothetical protein